MKSEDGKKEMTPAQLAEWDARIYSLEEKIKMAPADMKVMLAKELYKLCGLKRKANALM